MTLLQNDFLFHYTSFETLALILTNRTICFNSLQNVDDMDEAETEDMYNFGKYVFASCWTDDPNESIALWNLYTPNMHGVRIALPRFPFKKYTYKKGQYYFSEDVVTCINVQKEYEDNKASISPDQPKLIKVEYTNDNNKLFPHIRTCSPENAVEKLLKTEAMSDASSYIHYSFEQLGKYKRLEWEFQHEWRYLITMSPMGLQEMYPLTFEKQKEIIRRIDNHKTKTPYDRFFLDLSDEAVKQMQIILGPRMNEAEKIYVKSLLKDHGLEKNWRVSSLRIR